MAPACESRQQYLQSPKQRERKIERDGGKEVELDEEEKKNQQQQKQLLLRLLLQ